MTRRRVVVAVRVVALLSLVASVVVATTATSFGGPVVVGDTVLQAGTLAPGLFAAGVVGGGLLLLLRAPAPGAPPLPSHPQRSPRHGRRVAAVALLVVAAGVGSAVAAFRDLGVGYVVLEPASAKGCRVVVGQVSFLMAGSGTVSVLPPGSLVAREVSDYTADDGGRPVDEGGYRLRWSGESGVLELRGRPGDPVFPGLHEVTCG